MMVAFSYVTLICVVQNLCLFLLQFIMLIWLLMDRDRLILMQISQHKGKEYFRDHSR